MFLHRKQRTPSSCEIDSLAQHALSATLSRQDSKHNKDSTQGVHVIYNAQNGGETQQRVRLCC